MATALTTSAERTENKATLRRNAVMQRDRRERLIRPHVLGDGLFHSTLTRERKRADRTNQPFVLLRVAAEGAAQPNWGEAIRAITAAKRETDILGWIESRTVLGVVLTEVQTSGAQLASVVRSRIQRELAKRLETGAAQAFSIDVFTYPDPALVDRDAVAPVDPLLEQIGVRQPSARVERLKRALDIVGSLALLIATAPLFAIVAIAIKLKSPGPVFFRQVRVGRQMQPFTMLKFRTMRVDADPKVHQEYVTWFINQSKGQTADGTKDGIFKIKQDPRVTSVGRILRKTSLDELPQFVNVLRGDMSLVGPRPPLFFEVEQYQRWHCRRVLEAKPGITGLWQVTGRSRTNFDDMVRLDLQYAKKRSFLTDLKILIATPLAVFTTKGAC